MNIILNKDGKISVNESPLQGKQAETLDNIAVILSDPQDGDTIVYDGTAGVWKAGSGSAGGILYVTADADTNVLDHTWKEIWDAFHTKIVVMDWGGDPETGYSFLYLREILPDSETHEGYSVKFLGTGESFEFATDSENGYPVFSED